MRPRIGVTRGANPVTAYRRALEAAGAEVLELTGKHAGESAEDVLAPLDGLLLPGGADIDPRIYGEHEVQPSVEISADRDALELPLARAALGGGVPVLGICRGIQTLNVAAGGTLWQDLPSLRPSGIVHKEPAPGRDRGRLLHTVVLDPCARIRGIFGIDVLTVNSIHHQAVRDPAPRLVPVAAAPDGTIEAVEAPQHPFALGVQWHPEDLWEKEPVQARLFAAFAAAALNRARAR